MAIIAAWFLILMLLIIKLIVGFNLLSRDVFVSICIAGITLLLVYGQDRIKKYIIQRMVPFQVSKEDIPEPPKRLVQFSALYANSVATCFLVGAGGSAVTAFWRGGYTPPSGEMIVIMGWTISTLVVIQFSLVSAWTIAKAIKSFGKSERKTLLRLYVIGRNYTLGKSTKRNK